MLQVGIHGDYCVTAGVRHPGDEGVLTYSNALLPAMTLRLGSAASAHRIFGFPDFRRRVLLQEF